MPALVTCAGINHRTSPVEERERLAIGKEGLQDALANLGSRLGGAVILSTCNRTELYAAVPADRAEELPRLLNVVRGAAVPVANFHSYQHVDAVRHLFRVAAGIDSMVLGESQVLGQVREAMSAAREAGTLNGALAHVFHAALATGKRARTETEIGRHAVSVGSAAVALARQCMGDLEGKTVLVLGTGSAGKSIAKALARQNVRILVGNRTIERAAELADRVGSDTDAVALDSLQQALVEADIVISGTGAGKYVIAPEDVAPAMAARGVRSLLFIDIAVPRDIDPAVASIPGVHLRDIDEIEAVADEGWSGRNAELLKVEAIIDEEIARFEAWWDSLDVVPVIAALRGRADAIRARELERALKRLEGLGEEDRERIEAMTEAIVNKMLDGPIARLKSGAHRSRYVEAIEDLFNIQRSRYRRPGP